MNGLVGFKGKPGLNARWRRKTVLTGVGLVWVWMLSSGLATTRYVDVNNPNPGPPYSGWLSAANTIQDAVDASESGDEILVTNGVYQAGGRIVQETVTPTTNRVAVTKPLTIRSVNGPTLTVIKGYQVPDQTNGDAAVRCVYLTNGAALAGFTLTGGATGTNVPDLNYTARYASANGGGVLCESTSAVLSNCVLVGNSAFWWGGGVNRGTLLDCTISNNTAGYLGGGACGEQVSLTEVTCILSNCVVASNSELLPGSHGGGATSCQMVSCVVTGNHGGGAIACFLTNCMVVGNQGLGAHGSCSNCIVTANTDGGAVGNLIHCTISGNSTPNTGGGAKTGVLQDCIITNNSAANGGGTANATVINCLIAGNTADYGGADYRSTLYNCTIVSNLARIDGGGTYISSLRNCILYYNTAPVDQNYFADVVGLSLDFCCTTPMPTNGQSNLIVPPLFVDLQGGDYRLQGGSPGIDAGDNAYTNIPYPGYPNVFITVATDLDGKPRVAGPNVDMGAYEFQGPPPTTPPVLSISRVGDAVVLSWSASATNYVLETASELVGGSGWSGINQGIATVGGSCFFTNVLDAVKAFYRLHRAAAMSLKVKTGG